MAKSYHEAYLHRSASGYDQQEVGSLTRRTPAILLPTGANYGQQSQQAQRGHERRSWGQAPEQTRWRSQLDSMIPILPQARAAPHLAFNTTPMMPDNGSSTPLPARQETMQLSNLRDGEPLAKSRLPPAEFGRSPLLSPASDMSIGSLTKLRRRRVRESRHSANAPHWSQVIAASSGDLQPYPPYYRHDQFPNHLEHRSYDQDRELESEQRAVQVRTGSSTPTATHTNAGNPPRTDIKSMSISNLLSKPGSDDQVIPTVNLPPDDHKIKTFLSTPVPNSDPVDYHLFVRQQPFAARSCGCGERDRRVIDPPPIVQLQVRDTPSAKSLSHSERNRIERNPYMVMHCTIWDETGTRDMSSMPENHRSQQKRLMGTVVASPFVALDEHGVEGCFFCFPDLSCRTAGAFSLKFQLVVLAPSLSARAGQRSPISATVYSDSFRVHTAKDFPGMRESTALTKRLREQGCPICLKKGSGKSKKRARGQGKRGGGGSGGSNDMELGDVHDVDEDKGYQDYDDGRRKHNRSAGRSA